jgi:hypothetical protein
MQNTAVVQTTMLALTDSQLAQLAIAATAVTAGGRAINPPTLPKGHHRRLPRRGTSLAADR